MVLESTDTLKQEHRAIELVLDTMQKAAARIEAGDEINLSIVEDCLNFISGFADRCHHAKEEEMLFPLLEQRGVTRDGGPIGAMLHEHDQGRSLIRTMQTSLQKWTGGDESARTDLVEAMKCYITLLRSHIQKEDQVMFELADAALTDEDDKMLVASFDEIEEEKIGPGVHEEYHRMLDDLAERAAKL